MSTSFATRDRSVSEWRCLALTEITRVVLAASDARLQGGTTTKQTNQKDNSNEHRSVS